MIAKRFGLNRSTTEERLKLQKIVYLLQACGMQFGYGYTWYKYGPYSQDLVYDAYAVLNSERGKFEEGTKGWEFSENTNRRLAEFQKQFADVLEDAVKLELLASVHFLRKECDEINLDEDKFIKYFKKRKPKLFNDSLPNESDIRRTLNICKSINSN